jgi:3-dehydroquinate dehydratase-2
MKTKPMRILVANGVNLDLLGRREPAIYGRQSLKDMEKIVLARQDDWQKRFKLTTLDIVFFQSNSEADYLNELSKDWTGLVINPGAWTHTSLALGDRLRGLGMSYVEVHLSQIHSREPIRQVSYTAAGALGVISGFGVDSYVLGVEALLTALAKPIQA